MSLFADPTEHAANPPATWRVTKSAAGRWLLTLANGDVLDTFPTRRTAQEHRAHGNLARQYDLESRWYAGEPVRGWRPWADIVAERDRLAARAVSVLTVTRHTDGQVLHTGTDLPRALAVLDAAGHATATLTAAPCQPCGAHADHPGHDAGCRWEVVDHRETCPAAATLTAAPPPTAPVEPVAPPTSLAGAVEPLLPIEWPTPARVVGRGRTATVDLDVLALF